MKYTISIEGQHYGKGITTTDSQRDALDEIRRYVETLKNDQKLDIRIIIK